jgi:uncharacterized membrane protein YeiB
MRETARVFAWGYTSPLGLFSYAAFYVQMATGILLGFLVGRRHWVERLPALREPIRRAQLAAFGLALVAGALALAFAFVGTEPDGAGFFVSLARTVGRAALMAFYALSVLRLLERPAVARWLRPFALAGRMPLSNYLLQTLPRLLRLLRLGARLLGPRLAVGRDGAGRRPVLRRPAAAQRLVALALSLRPGRVRLAPPHLRPLAG